MNSSEPENFFFGMPVESTDTQPFTAAGAYVSFANSVNICGGSTQPFKFYSVAGCYVD